MPHPDRITSRETTRQARSRWIAHLSILGAVGSAAFALTACNTTRGFGEDLQETGENISDAAEEVKPD